MKSYKLTKIFEMDDNLIKELSSYGPVLYGIKCLSNDKYYIGTTIDIPNRFLNNKYGYITKYNNKVDNKIINAFIEYGLDNFEYIIIDYNKPIEELENLEIDYIKLYDSYLDGFNSSVDGKSYSYNTIRKKRWINDGINDYLIFEDDLNTILSNPKYNNKFSIGRFTMKRRISVNKDSICKRIPIEELDDYLDRGFTIGALRLKEHYPNLNRSEYLRGTRVVNDGIRNYQIPGYKVDEYLQNGCIIGKIMSEESSCKGKIRVSKNGETKLIKESELNKYESEGYSRGIDSIKGRIHVNNGIDHKMIKESEVDYYLSLGYKLGKLGKGTKGKTWVNNGIKSTLIDKNKLDEYIKLGYHKGRIL